MKVSLKKLIGSAGALGKLLDLPFAGDVSYDINKLVKAVQNELNIFEKVRQETANKYSEDGAEVIKEKIPLFIEEMNQLGEKEVEIFDFKLTKDMLKPVYVPPEILRQLDWLTTGE